MKSVIPIDAIKGRGSATAIAHRFSRDERDAFDDGWGTLEDGVAEAADKLPLQTQVTFEDRKCAISRNDSPDIYFDCGLNPYRGCEHGCVYCYARPTHSYLGLSPGLDFETKIIAKRNLRLKGQATHFPVKLPPREYPSPSASPGRMPQVKKEPRAALLINEWVIFAAGDTEASALGWLRGCPAQESVLKRPEHLAIGERSAAMVDGFLDALALMAEPVHLHYLWRPQLRDAADEMLLETALNGRADALVTFNVQDFGAAKNFGLAVVTPADFLQMVQKECE